MRPKIAEFIIDSTVQEEGRFKVFGRCGDWPIRVDDRFTAIFRYRPRRYPDESGWPPTRCEEKPVMVRVVCVHAYGRSLPELGEGMTGLLVLDGPDLDSVGSGWILGDPEDSPVTSSHVADSAKPIG